MASRQWPMRSRIGPLYLVASERGLGGVFWRKQAVPMAESLRGTDAPVRILSRAARQLTEYLGGKRKRFDLPLDIEGTPFQKRVWAELARIPYAETRSYKDIASRIKKARAVRAVGGANGRNPLGIIVPCHRVIAQSGLLGGYSGRAGVKARLLELERTGRPA